jgi:PBSX family phage terminase large subunit
MQWGRFSKKALDFITNSNARLNIAHGSVRSSKTINCTVRWLDYIKTGPPGILFMIGKTTTTLQRNVLDDLFDIVGNRNYKWLDKQKGELMLFGRKIYCIGANDERAEEKIRGATIAGAYCDEVSLYPESFFNQLMARMSVPGAKCFCNTNPDSPYHWFYVNYINNQELIDRGIAKVWHFTMDDNPNLDEQYKKDLAAMYTGLWYKRMILGLWVMAEGAVYDMFKDNVNVITQDKLPDHFLKRYIGVDFGQGNPTVFLKFGLTYNEKNQPVLWQYDEYYHDGRKEGSKILSKYSSDMKKFIGDEYIDGIFIDPSALALINQFKADGINNIRHANNDVLSGIATVSSFIGSGRLFIVKERCPNTLREYNSYIWDPKAQQHGEDKPVKEHDHCMDATRYVCHTQFPIKAVHKIVNKPIGW